MADGRTLEEMYGVQPSAAASKREFEERLRSGPSAEDMRRSNEAARSTTRKRPVKPSDVPSGDARLQEMARANRQAESERAQAAMQGPPLPPDVAQRERGRADAIQRREAQLSIPGGAQDLDSDDYASTAFQRTPVTKHKRAMYEPTKALTGTLEQTTGLEREGALELVGERLATARQVAEQAEELAARQRNAHIDMQASEFARQERESETLGLLQNKMALQDKAAKALADTPPEDPTRWWASRGAGMKVAHVLGAIFSGLILKDPLVFIRRGISEEMAAQKGKRDARKEEFGTAQKGVDMAGSLLKETRAQGANEREGDLLTENAYLASVKAQIEAQHTQRGLAELIPTAKIMVAGIEEDMAKNRHEIEGINAANVPYRYTGGGYAHSKEERKYLLDKADEARAEGRDIRKGGRDLESAVALEQVKNPPRQLAPGEAELDEKDRSLLGQLMTDKQYQGAATTRKLAQKLLTISNAHGGKAPDVFGPFELTDIMRSEDKEEWDRTIGLMKGPLSQWISGSTLTPAQEEIVEKASGRGAWSAGERVRAVQDLANMMAATMQGQERSLSQPARQHLYRNLGLEDLSADFTTDKGDPAGFVAD